MLENTLYKGYKYIFIKVKMRDESEKDLPATAEFTISRESMCQKVDVQENQVFNILLGSNASALVHWTLKNPGKFNPDKLKPLNVREDGSGGYKSKSNLPGSPGYDIFKFNAGKSAFFATTLTFVCSRDDGRLVSHTHVKVKISK